MNKLRLAFCDFWPGFDPESNYFVDLLSQNWAVEISADPDVLIFSVFGKAHRSFKCLKIQYIGENIRPNHLICDYSISFDMGSNPRNYRWPLYNLYLYDLISNVPDHASHREKFCCVVTSNPNGKFRNAFYDALNTRIPVDSGGRFRNNIGAPIGNKLDFLLKYRFSFAFENSSYPGYTTEKIVESKWAGTIPIYWGNPSVAQDCNPEAFVNVHNFNSIRDCVEFIIELDKDSVRREKMRTTPLFSDVSGRFGNDAAQLIEWFDKVIHGGKIQRLNWPRSLIKYLKRWNRMRTGYFDRKEINRFNDTKTRSLIRLMGSD